MISHPLLFCRISILLPLFTLQMLSELYNALSSLQDVEQKCQAGLSECAAVSSDAGASKKTNISNEILPIRLFP